MFPEYKTKYVLFIKYKIKDGWKDLGDIGSNCKDGLIYSQVHSFCNTTVHNSDLTQKEKDKLHSKCCEETNKEQEAMINAYERGFIDGANLTGSQALEELKEQKQNILELIYKEINKTTKNGKDSRGCKCLENIYQKIIKLK